MFRCIQLNEEHDENPVIRKLLKLCHSHNVILQQNPSHNSQDLVEKINLCYSVCIVPRVFNQKGNKTDKGIQCVETLGPDQADWLGGVPVASPMAR